MTKKYDLQATQKNNLDQQLFSVIDLSTNSVVKADLLARDAALFIENVTILEEVKDYLEKKHLDIQRLVDMQANDKIPQEYVAMMSHPFNHDIYSLSLRIDRLLNSLTDKKPEDYSRAEKLIKKLSALNTTKVVEPLARRLKRAYYLFKTI